MAMSRARIWFSLFVLYFMIWAIGFCVHGLKAAERSGKWDAFRAEVLRERPYCELCGATENLTPHHIKLFADHPELELVKSNVIVLCDPPDVRHHGCHWKAGHLAIAWDVGNDEVKELVNGVGELLWRKRLVVLTERKQESVK